MFYEFTMQHVVLFMLVLTRTSGLVMMAPIYGGSQVPLQIRALLAVVLGLLISPTQSHVEFNFPHSPVELTVMLLGELTVGLMLGLGILILFVGMQLSGQVISQLSGMGLAEVFNPGLETNAPLFAQVMYLLSLTVFVLIGGHRLVMAALLNTFAEIPAGSGTLSATLADTLATMLGASFELGIRAAAPVLTAQLSATLVLGLIGRTLPQLNILLVGFGLSVMVTLVTLSLTLGGAAEVFQDRIDLFIELFHDALRLAPDGTGIFDG